ncbi:unnamed protein product [Darwinula stevensoni]|uniref:Uncharacterized protein n=1 Tax=Darwinula stevensoni TaxID=69355 RepID=A0A7R9AAZ7_9CRUS|nr:unnamed protein product [Darwinula stevensoni]CAG0898870.1 unnamed protein product [Darwinula stevensoni]
MEDVDPLYVSPSSETDETDVHSLTDRELEILTNAPAKSVIKGDSETELMKVMMEKVRNIVAKWFSKRPIIERRRVLVLGTRNDIMEKLIASMLEWIVSSAIDTYSTWTTLSAKKMRRRVQNLINKNLIFCAFFPDEASEEVPTIEEPMNAGMLCGLDIPKVRAIAGRLYERMVGTTEHPGIHEWQDIQKSNTKFHHIFVLGAHELSEAFVDIHNLHLRKAHGYFWLLFPETDLPSTLVAEIAHFGFLMPDRKSLQGIITARNSPVRESTWLYQAEDFIKRTYHWGTENTTRLVPPVENMDEWIETAKTVEERAKRSLILRLHQLGRKSRTSMFITYNSDFVHLIETRNVGGGIEGILQLEEHDVVLIHRNFGVIFIQLKNHDAEEAKKEVGNATKNIQTAAEHLEMEFQSMTATKTKLEAAMRKCGLEDANVSLHVIAFPTLSRDQVEGKQFGDNPVFLNEEDCRTAEALEEWWRKHILHSDHLQSSSITEEMYIKLLAIFIAPLHATPANTARMNRQNLSFLTEDKLNILVNREKEFVVKGAAGTGKKCLLQEKIRNIVMSWFSRGPIEDKNEMILLICRNAYGINKLGKTLYDLLLTSAMTVLGQWIDGTGQEEESKKVRGIIEKNVIICCLDPKPNASNSQLEQLEDIDDSRSRLQKAAKDLASSQALDFDAARMKNASWEIFLCYELLKSCMVTYVPPYDEKKEWSEIMRKARNLFEFFTSSAVAMQNLMHDIYVLQEEMGIGSIGPLKLIGARKGIHVAMMTLLISLKQINAQLGILSERTRYAILENLSVVLKTQKPAFDHVFVDDAEKWCQFYDDHWLTMLRSLHKEGRGCFWWAYDPLSYDVDNLTDSLKSEVEGAHPLYAILRNTGSVFEAWIRHKMPLGKHDNTAFSTTRDLEYDIGKIKLESPVRGPKVEIFHVTLFDLAEKIVKIVEEKFPHANHKQDIAIIFADMLDFRGFGLSFVSEVETYGNKRYFAIGPAEFFHGLEAPIVFLIIDRRWKKSNHLYHGASRSTSHLFILAFESMGEEAVLKRRVDESLRLFCPDELPEVIEDPLRTAVRHSLLRHSPKPIIEMLTRIAIARQASKEASYFPQLPVITNEEGCRATLRSWNIRSMDYGTLGLVSTWIITGQAIFPQVVLIADSLEIQNQMD